MRHHRKHVLRRIDPGVAALLRVAVMRSATRSELVGQRTRKAGSSRSARSKVAVRSQPACLLRRPAGACDVLIERSEIANEDVGVETDHRFFARSPECSRRIASFISSTVTGRRRFGTTSFRIPLSSVMSPVLAQSVTRLDLQILPYVLRNRDLSLAGEPLMLHTESVRSPTPPSASPPRTPRRSSPPSAPSRCCGCRPTDSRRE